VGRTGRAEATGDAFTFVAADEEPLLKAIERAIGRALPRVTLPDFDYKAKAGAQLEIPLKDRIAEIRKRKAEERARAAAKAARRSASLRGHAAPPQPSHGDRRPPAAGARRHGRRPPRRP
jgi:ATP-dependent RNA helicase RhlE